MLKSED